MHTASHELLRALREAGLDRVFLVPGESYLGLLDALNDFPDIDVLTCRHESGAGFMAMTDGRLAGRAGVALVSRGPGACNAAIAVHAAAQDAAPMILIVGQVPRADLRRGAFQEIDYQRMFGGVAKWVFEAIDPGQVPEAACRAARVAVSGTPGPVVLVVPEDLQDAPVRPGQWAFAPAAATVPDAVLEQQLRSRLAAARCPLIVAGGLFERPGGREALRALAEAWQVPVVVSFRRNDLFPNDHPLYAGELGLANPAPQIAALREADLLLALGTRLGDITTQGYTLPDQPRPAQALAHCYPDEAVLAGHFIADWPLACDPVALAWRLAGGATPAPREAWCARLRGLYVARAAWTPGREHADGVDFGAVVQALQPRLDPGAVLCLDAGTFAAPVYRHLCLRPPQRMLASICGSMGYGVPAAVAARLRLPGQRVACAVGDGGFLMTGAEAMAAVERQLPIVFLLSNNGAYGSIRIHQERRYPGRVMGTGLFNPDFTAMATAMGMAARRLDRAADVADALDWALDQSGPCLLEVRSSLQAVLP